MSDGVTALSLRDIRKSFGDVEVLHGITLEISEGTTLGLVGENGAGKSTMLNILGGQFRPSAGEMQLFGRGYAPDSPGETRANKIAFIHQELNLFENLSIEENFNITSFPVKRICGLPVIDRKKIRESTREHLNRVGLKHTPDTLVETLAPGEKQLVEIAKALSQEARIILFDEPTTSLTSHESERLFDLIADLQSDGLTLIYISHELPDVLRICDDVAVLRDGNLITHKATDQMTEDMLIKFMVGRSIDQLFPTRTVEETGKLFLEVKSLSTLDKLNKVSFKLHSGEILGLFGLIGAGRTETLRAMFGIDPLTTGEILVDGEAMKHPSPRKVIDQGMAFITEDRKGDGLCLPADITTNMTLASFPELSRGWPRGIDRTRQAEVIEELREAVYLDQNTRDDQAVSTLSGGNQQKVVLGRWLYRKPRILLLDEPTRGVDIGAKEIIYKLIVELADKGTAVLLVSSEIEELLGLSDRILVMKDGQVSREVPKNEFNREVILEAALSGEIHE